MVRLKHSNLSIPPQSFGGYQLQCRTAWQHLPRPMCCMWGSGMTTVLLLVVLCCMSVCWGSWCDRGRGGGDCGVLGDAVCCTLRCAAPYAWSCSGCARVGSLVALQHSVCSPQCSLPLVEGNTRAFGAEDGSSACGFQSRMVRAVGLHMSPVVPRPCWDVRDTQWLRSGLCQGQHQLCCAGGDARLSPLLGVFIYFNNNKTRM